MKCLMLAGMVFIQTESYLINVNSIDTIYKGDNRIEVSVGSNRTNLLEDQSISSIIKCLKTPEGGSYVKHNN